MRRLAAICFAAVLASGCGDPPHKEMDQAQGAIDAARAAGAERYAREAFQAAVDALERAHDAVQQRDYRLALSHALDSRERAQNAAKLAADQKAVVRSEAERLLNEAALAIVQAHARLRQADNPRISRRLATARERIAAAESAVQKARAALDQEDYLSAREILRGAKPAAAAAQEEIERVATQTPARRRK